MDTGQSSLQAVVQRRGTALVVASLGSAVLGLLASWPYKEETGNWVLQAQGQDLGNLVAVVALIVGAVRMRAGSLKAVQLWAGTLFYLLYAYIVYSFAVHFGRLFLVYVAILGLVFYTLIAALPTRARPAAYPRGAVRVFAAWVLIGTGALFALLWLSEPIPATVSGQAPPSQQAAGLIVNPIHVIDLSVVLPGMITIGILALRGNRTGLFLTVPALVFCVLMGSSIIAAMLLIVMSGGYERIGPDGDGFRGCRHQPRSSPRLRAPAYRAPQSPARLNT
ncbi:hypothetical protein [Arthrobacter crystallopoietes]|uniref:hypothetical protein n=1 Tax=Crystallibacter crystallopoietes TaxID=37928 RepID=UPI0011114872|nr:hypothetical protein [Arthrobacter crystallopoietes]